MNYSPEQLLEFWKEGIALGNAAWIFADEKLQTEYKNAHSEINYKNNATEIPKGLINLLENVSKEMEKANQLSKQKEIVNNSLWNNLYQRIISGNLIAAGYKFPIESDYPTLIPVHMWPPDNIDAVKSAISANEIKYVRVRIIKKSALDIFQEIPTKNEKQLPKYKLQKKKAGRPSIGDAIVEAYHMLDKDGQIDITLPLSSHYEAIRDVVSKSRPDLSDDTGMKDEAIRKRVAEFFNAKKKSHKPSHKL